VHFRGSVHLFWDMVPALTRWMPTKINRPSAGLIRAPEAATFRQTGWSVCPPGTPASPGKGPDVRNLVPKYPARDGREHRGGE